MFINRPGSISTLPMDNLTKNKNALLDRPYIKLIQALEATGKHYSVHFLKQLIK